jgi:hypothetical protein
MMKVKNIWSSFLFLCQNPSQRTHKEILRNFIKQMNNKVFFKNTLNLWEEHDGGYKVTICIDNHYWEACFDSNGNIDGAFYASR